MHGRRGAHSYYGNIGKQFPRSPSSTNGAKLAFIRRRVPWLTEPRRATSSFWRLTTHLKNVHLSTQTPFISALPNFAIRCWAIGCFAASCLPTQDESSICRLQRNQELKSCGGERECNILRLSLVLVTLRRKPSCRVIMLFFCKR